MTERTRSPFLFFRNTPAAGCWGNYWVYLLFACLTIGLGLRQPTVFGDGNITFTLRANGDINIIGDSLDNHLEVRVSHDGEDVIVSTTDGTTLTLIEPGHAPFVGTFAMFAVDELIFARNLTLDLRGGNNTAVIDFLPLVIARNLRINLGRGRNQLQISTRFPVEVYGSFDVRGSRADSDSEVILSRVLSGEYHVNNFSLDVGGDHSYVKIDFLTAYRNFSATIRGRSAELRGQAVTAIGRTNLAATGSSDTVISFYQCNFKGRSSIRSTGDFGRVFLDECLVQANFDLRVGRTGNLVVLFFSHFESLQGARFTAGRGTNEWINFGSTFLVPPVVRGF